MSFIDTPTVPGAKVNVFPVPATANPANYNDAADTNEITAALLDLRTNAINGRGLGLNEQASAPSWPFDASTSFIWALNDGTLMYRRSGVDYPLDMGASTSPSFVLGSGAGANATASITGNDRAGHIVIHQNVLDTPPANQILITVSFGTSYRANPTMIFQPANDATWALTYGTLIQHSADQTMSQIVIRIGATPLPATTTAIYSIQYMVML
jgi:hypothetical protein